MCNHRSACLHWVVIFFTDYKKIGVADWIEMPSYLLAALWVTLWSMGKAISKNYFNEWDEAFDEA